MRTLKLTSAIIVSLICFGLSSDQLQPNDLLNNAYEMNSDSLMNIFLRTWQVNSSLLKKQNISADNKTTTQINSLLEIAITLNGKEASNGEYRVIPDSVLVMYYKKDWRHYPQTGRLYSNAGFPVYSDSTILLLTKPYGKTLLTFLDSSRARNLSYLRGDSALPSRLAFLQRYLPLDIQKEGTFNSTYYSELETWRKTTGVPAICAWTIETKPFVTRIYMKTNFKEAYVCLNRFSDAQVVQYVREKNKWVVVPE